MSYNLTITSAFEKDARPLLKKYKSLKNDLDKLFESLEKEPIQGDSLGKNCYKIRLAIASKGKGKSGGARVVIHVKMINNMVYLLTIYDKSKQEDISEKELQFLLSLIE